MLAVTVLASGMLPQDSKRRRLLPLDNHSHNDIQRDSVLLGVITAMTGSGQDITLLRLSGGVAVSAEHSLQRA
jgi:hypothetical protein